MSAICGIINWDKSSISHEMLATLNYSLRNYGGDGANIWNAGHIGFGHQMSHLTLESLNEVLPYYDEATRIAVTADIRLFNRKELCAQLNLCDEVYLSDSQIILAAYNKFGKKFAEYLIGEYSIALWDGKTHEMILITDHFMHNPIYYYQDEQIFAFATSIDALRCLPQVKQSINLKKIALSSYCEVHQYPGETYFTNIKFLPPASLMTIFANGQSNISHYWQPKLPEETTQFKSEDEFTERFQEVFSRVIQDMTRTHLPVCSLLSGGLDSSGITAMASHVLAQQQRSLTSLSAVLSRDSDRNAKDESYYINLLQANNLTKLNILADGRGPFDNLMNLTSEVNASSRYYLYHAFNDAARTVGSKIILDGCYGEIAGPSYWGDEYLGQLFRKFRYIKLIQNIWQHKQLFARTFRSILFHDVLKPNLPLIWQRQLQTNRNLIYGKPFSLIRSEFVNQHVSQQQLTHELENFKNLNTKPSGNVRVNNFTGLQWLFKNKTPTSIITSDKDKSVIHYRYPYLDKRLIEFCLSVPNELRYKNGYRRYIIRRGMHGIMPSELCYRTTKEPFSPDYHIRYKKQISIAREAMDAFKNNSLVQEVLDTERLNKYFDIEMSSNRCSSKNDFIGMHIVPSAIYIASFLVNNS